MDESGINILIESLREIEKKVVSNRKKMDEMSQKIYMLKNKLDDSNKLIANLRSENDFIKSTFSEEFKEKLSKISSKLNMAYKKSSEKSPLLEK